MDELEIQKRVARMADHLERLFLNSDIDRKTYDLGLQDLEEWAAAKRTAGVMVSAQGGSTYLG